MLQRLIAASVYGMIVVVLAGSLVAKPTIQQPHPFRVKTLRNRDQDKPSATIRSKQLARTPSDSSDSPLSSASIANDFDTGEAINGLSAVKEPKATNGSLDHVEQTSPRGLIRRATINNSRLADKVKHVLDDYYTRPFNTRDYDPWSVLHWSIAYGVDAQVCKGGPNGQRVTAIGWLCCNRPAAGKRLVSPRPSGMLLPIAPGIQGHHGQFLSMLAQSRVPANYVFRVGSDELTIADLVEHEKNTCRKGMELTFKLIGISHYTPSDEQWKNARGETWSVEKLLEKELKEPIDRMEACCGGSHRLFAMSYAVHRRNQEGLPITGPWELAERRIEAYQRKAFQMQNGDGSFSTMWLERLENRSDKNRKLITSGHLLEWLAFSLPDDRLHEAKFERALAFVASLLDRYPNFNWQEGGLGHALHALAIYEQRVLGSQPGQRMQLLGQSSL